MRKQFNLQDWLKDKSQNVETRDGRPARIICTDAKADDGACIIALIPGYGGEEAYQLFPDGRAFSSKSSDEDCADLFLVTPEPELTPLEDLLSTYLKNDFEYFSTKKWDEKKWNEVMRIQAAELLSLARKQLQPEIDAEIEKAYKNVDEVQYRKGREEALKDLPRWKKVGLNTGQTTLVIGYIGEEDKLYRNGYVISLPDLEKLPKEDEE